jgi:hypothetical protein
MNPSFAIPKRAKTCSLGKEPFQPGMEYFSLIYEDLKSYVREDYCEACWKKALVKEEAKYWKAKIPDRKREEESENYQAKRAKGMTLLRNLLLQTDEHSTAEAFILALFLARQKQLCFRKQLSRSDGLYDLYEVEGSEEIISVSHIHLSKLKVEEIQKSLAQQLC